jgi:5'-nucleotidase
MPHKLLTLSILPLAAAALQPAHALDIVLTNDDGCESSATHALHQRLLAAGHRVVMSASVADQSGQGGALGFLRPITPLAAPSRGGNLPAGTPGLTTLGSAGGLPYGGQVWCVNATPVAATLAGIDVAAQAAFGKAADLVISGPNYGNNTGLVNNHSGTVNAALVALNRGIPAVAVSAASPSSYRAFNALAPADLEYENADLVVTLVARLVDARARLGGAVLPRGTALNVNLPRYAAGGSAALVWDWSRVGLAASAVPYFVTDLSTSTVAAGFGLAGVKLPGISVKVPGVPDPATAGLSFIEDTRASSEQNSVQAGRIAVSVIEGNHQAGDAAVALVRERLKGLVTQAD